MSFPVNASRRQLLQNVSAGVMGYGLAEMLAIEANAAGSDAIAPLGRAKNVLVIYEEGGISQMDTWDPKPHAPVEHRTPYMPIDTNVPGIQFSSLMPNIAKHADKLSIVRSMTTARIAGHREGCKEFFKGYRFDSPVDFPDIGSVVTETLGSEAKSLPGYIFVPGANMPNAINGSGFLHPSRKAWKLGTKSLGENVADPDWKVRGLQPLAGLSRDRFDRRQELLGDLNISPYGEVDSARALSKYYENAFDLLTNAKLHAAFDVESESKKTLDRYGRDHRGRCYLLGRKMIEAGIRFVSVTVIQPPDLVGRPNYGQPNGVFLNWDHHFGIYQNGPCGHGGGKGTQERYGLSHPVMMPSLDRSFSALLEDMDQRGLLEETLVCFVTEMGRTPRVNKWEGRDHWGRAMSIAFAGAGVPGGQIIGKTNRDAGDVIEKRYTPYDYAETIYRKLGIETHARLKNPDGRPIDFSDGGLPIAELF